MSRPWSLVRIAAVAAFALSGCAIYPGTARPTSLEDLRRDEGWTLLDSVPYVPQVSEKGCGAACLAMVLGHMGIETPAVALEEECVSGAEEGIKASALRDAARRRGLSAYLFAGTLKDLEHELARGRPVVVGLVKSYGGKLATSHFEVVVGLHAGQRRIAVLDPAVGLMHDSLDGFEGEWRATQGVMLVVFVPEARAVLASRDGPLDGGSR